MSAASGTFVLIHGACHGGWCWDETASYLRSKGHDVHTPTLPGLGEKAHLLSAETDLEMMTDAVIADIEAAQLNDICLVGHSFGGAIITAIADKMAPRLSRLIYLDAVWVEGGQSIFDTMDADLVAERRELVRQQGQGIALPVPPPQAFGVTDPSQASALMEKLTPHPIASYETPLTLSHPVTNGLPADYVVCTDPLYAPLSGARDQVRQMGLAMHKLRAPHDAMITHPIETAEMLLSLSTI